MLQKCVLTVNVSPAGDVTGEVIRQHLITRKFCNSYEAIVIDGLFQFHDSNVISKTDRVRLKYGHRNKNCMVSRHYTRCRGHDSTQDGQ